MAHTTTTAAAAAPKPEALRCAEWLEHIAGGGDVLNIDELAWTAAAELRRSHALLIDLLPDSLEYAEYLARGAERLIDAVDANAKVRLRIAESDDGDNDTADDAHAAVDEAQRNLRNDIGLFRRRRDRAIAALAARDAGPAPRPMETAPKDGSMVLLLVEHDGTSFEDSDEPGWTIGFNNLGNTGEDTWQFAGWDWCQDNYTQGVGKPVAWLPMLAAAAPQEPDAAIMDTMVEKAWGRFEAEMQRQTARAAVAPALLEGRAHFTYTLTAESGYEQTGEHHNITPEVFGAVIAALHSPTEPTDQVLATEQSTALAEYAARYEWLRSRDLDAIQQGGVFAGKTPDNVVLNGTDLDAAIDAERRRY